MGMFMTERVKFLQLHFEQAERALAEGVPLKGLLRLVFDG
jgi:beta-glucosidase/6-phospho-beta-glucosidase/beta-galactosidase